MMVGALIRGPGTVGEVWLLGDVTLLAPSVADAAEPAASPSPWWRRVVTWIFEHPLLVVFGVGTVLAVVQGVWIWNHRLLGALDPDESGYIATAFRYQRTLGHDPLALPRAIGGTGNGPLIPLLTVPLLWLGPQDPRTALLIQPILGVVTAVASAGIARKLAGAGAALVTGIVFLTFPTVLFAIQTYWLGLGAAAFMALGAWALLESDRLTNRWLYAYGAATGAMLLCRTMTIGFLPAMAVAGLIVAGRERASLIGWAKAMATTVVVAGPWWFVARDPIFSYLFSYGYGKRAGLFGGGGPPERVQQRWNAVILGVGWGWRWIIPVLACSAFVLWRRRADGRAHGWPAVTRLAVAIAVASALGIAALASTSNNGVWFELPIIALLVPLAIAAGAAAPKVVKAVALLPVLAVGVLQMGCSLWLIAPGQDALPGIATVHRVAQYEYGFEQYDKRFGPFRRSQLPAAARDWHDLSTTVERRLRKLSPNGEMVFTTSGNFEMFNSNTVELAAAQHGWTPRLWIPDTVGNRKDRKKWLTPKATDDAGNPVIGSDGKPVERVLLLAIHHQHLFTPDAQVRDLYQDAKAAGWTVVDRFPMPVGGDVLILRHPDRP